MPARLTPILAAVLVLFALAACSGDTSPQGRYAGATAEGPVTLELKDNGKGEWSTPDEDIAVSWERRGDEIWLHTRSGGVIICAPGPGDTLDAKVPGVGRISLSRQQP